MGPRALAAAETVAALIDGLYLHYGLRSAELSRAQAMERMESYLDVILATKGLGAVAETGAGAGG